MKCEGINTNRHERDRDDVLVVIHEDGSILQAETDAPKLLRGRHDHRLEGNNGTGQLNAE